VTTADDAVEEGHKPRFKVFAPNGLSDQGSELSAICSTTSSASSFLFPDERFVKFGALGDLNDSDFRFHSEQVNLREGTKPKIAPSCTRSKHRSFDFGFSNTFTKTEANNCVILFRSQSSCQLSTQ
jgi:hypothetical protein